MGNDISAPQVIPTTEGNVVYQPFADDNGVQGVAQQYDRLKRRGGGGGASTSGPLLTGKAASDFLQPLRKVDTDELNNISIWTRIRPKPVYSICGNLGLCMLLAERIIGQRPGFPLLGNSRFVVVRKVAAVDPSIVEVDESFYEVTARKVIENIERGVLLFRPDEDLVRIVQADGTTYDESWDALLKSSDPRDVRALSMLTTDYPSVWNYTSTRPGKKQEQPFYTGSRSGIPAQAQASEAVVLDEPGTDADPVAQQSPSSTYEGQATGENDGDVRPPFQIFPPDTEDDNVPLIVYTGRRNAAKTNTVNDGSNLRQQPCTPFAIGTDTSSRRAVPNAPEEQYANRQSQLKSTTHMNDLLPRGKKQDTYMYEYNRHQASKVYSQIDGSGEHNADLRRYRNVQQQQQQQHVSSADGSKVQVPLRIAYRGDYDGRETPYQAMLGDRNAGSSGPVLTHEHEKRVRELYKKHQLPELTVPIDKHHLERSKQRVSNQCNESDAKNSIHVSLTDYYNTENAIYSSVLQRNNAKENKRNADANDTSGASHGGIELGQGFSFSSPIQSV